MTEIFIHFTNSTPNKNERVSPMKQPLVLYQNGYSEAGPHDAWKLFVCLGLEESKYKKKEVAPYMIFLNATTAFINLIHTKKLYT